MKPSIGQQILDGMDKRICSSLRFPEIHENQLRSHPDRPRPMPFSFWKGVQSDSAPEEPKLGKALFVSHQWLGKRHPDPEFTQFSVLQDALKHMMSEVQHVDPKLNLVSEPKSRVVGTEVGERDGKGSLKWDTHLPF